MADMTDSTIDTFLTPFAEAIEELKRRRQDPELQDRVRAYLNGDIPEYFGDTPIFYLARHVATPNFETLRFVHLLESSGFRTVISQDTQDFFFAANDMKKALLKLPVHTGHSSKGGVYQERFENYSITDLNAANGKRFSELKTHWGQPVTEFHQELCQEFFHHKVEVIDDSAWIDRNERGNLLAHYQKFLALFIVHGVLFEDYLIEDERERHFITAVLAPAFRFVQDYFGLQPLISQLNPTSIESEHFWISYPAAVGDRIKKKYTQK